MDEFLKNETQSLRDLISAVSQLVEEQTRTWLRTQEAADYLGISVTQIHHLKRNGILPFSKLGGSIYFKKSDIDEILEGNKEEVQK